jgi:hypothetical protein
MDVVHLSLFFYNIPLALVAFLIGEGSVGEFTVFLNAAAGDSATAGKTLLMTMLASASVALGALMGRAVGRSNRPHLLVPLSASLQRNAGRFAFISILGIALGVSLFGFSTFFEGYAIESLSATAASGTALVFFAYEVIGICAFVWLCCQRATGLRTGKAMIVLALLTVTCITMLRGKRLELIIALLPIFLILWSSVLRRPFHRVGAVVLLVAAISSLASFRYGELPTVASLAFNTFSEGLYAGHVTPGIIEAVDGNSVGFEHGLRYVAALAAFIPRFVFPGKDELLYQTLTDIAQFAPLGATSLLGEVYLQGGTVAVALSFLVVGVVGALVAVDKLVARSMLPLTTLLYVLFICSFIPHFRDGIMPSIKIPLQLLVVLLLLIALAGTRLRLAHKRQRQHRNPDTQRPASSVPLR